MCSLMQKIFSAVPSSSTEKTGNGCWPHTWLLGDGGAALSVLRDHFESEGPEELGVSERGQWPTVETQGNSCEQSSRRVKRRADGMPAGIIRGT